MRKLDKESEERNLVFKKYREYKADLRKYLGPKLPPKLRVKANKNERGKKESVIEKEHEDFFRRNNILFWNTKVRGEIQAIGKGKFTLKKSANKGFSDMLLAFGPIAVFLELKSGDGGYLEPEQIAHRDRVVNQGGYALISNSVADTKTYLESKGLI